MATAQLDPNSAVGSDENAWLPNGEHTRLQAILVHDDEKAVIQDGDGPTLTVGFEDSPADVGSVTNLTVSVYAQGGAVDANLDCELFIAGASKGVDTRVLPDLFLVDWVYFNLPAWNGPWSQAQLNHPDTRVVFEVSMFGKNGQTYIFGVRMDLEYELADRSGHGPGALQLTDMSGTELTQMSRIGTVSGVAIEHVAGLNDAASGTIRVAADGRTFQFKAPGSSAYGPPLVVLDGWTVTDILRDGDDPDKYLRVSIDAVNLPSGQMEGHTTFRRRYYEGTDVTAAQAQAGNVGTLPFKMKNVSPLILSNLRAWLDNSVSFLEISDDMLGPWVSPTTEAAAQEFPDLAPGDTDIVWVRRTIPAVTGFDPAVAFWLHFAFDGGP